MKSLDPLRVKKTFVIKKLGHTAISAIKASSVTLYTWQKGPEENTVYLKILTWQSFQRLMCLEPGYLYGIQGGGGEIKIKMKSSKWISRFKNRSETKKNPYFLVQN